MIPRRNRQRLRRDRARCIAHIGNVVIADQRTRTRNSPIHHNRLRARSDILVRIGKGHRADVFSRNKTRGCKARRIRDRRAPVISPALRRCRYRQGFLRNVGCQCRYGRKLISGFCEVGIASHHTDHSSNCINTDIISCVFTNKI